MVLLLRVLASLSQSPHPRALATAEAKLHRECASRLQAQHQLRTQPIPLLPMSSSDRPEVLASCTENTTAMEWSFSRSCIETVPTQEPNTCACLLTADELKETTTTTH